MVEVRRFLIVRSGLELKVAGADVLQVGPVERFTAIDQRDIEPLVRAAQNVLEHWGFGARKELAEALAPFRRSNLSPSESGASGPENLRIPKDDAPDQPSGERAED